MEFLRPKIIVKKDEEGNYILKKKANISLILSLLILFFLIFKGLKRMEKMEYLFNIEYIGTNIVAFFIFFLYFYVICIFFSKEIFEFKNKEIKIKKYFLLFCYYKKTIKIKEIVKIKYISTGKTFSVILTILLATIGMTRIYLGVHYPSDVIGGFLVSLTYLFILTEIYNRIKIEEK